MHIVLRSAVAAVVFLHARNVQKKRIDDAMLYIILFFKFIFGLKLVFVLHGYNIVHSYAEVKTMTRCQTLTVLEVGAVNTVYYKTETNIHTQTLHSPHL